MTNHPNRKTKSKLDVAFAIIARDARSGYAEADTAGRRNIRRNVKATIQAVYGTADEIDACGESAEEIASRYIGHAARGYISW